MCIRDRVPFRAADLSVTVDILQAMVGMGTTSVGAITTTANRLLVSLVMGGTYLAHAALRAHRVEEHAKRIHPGALGVILGVAWLTIWLAQPDDRAFIYFQF